MCEWILHECWESLAQAVKRRVFRLSRGRSSSQNEILACLQCDLGSGQDGNSLRSDLPSDASHRPQHTQLGRRNGRLDRCHLRVWTVVVHVLLHHEGRWWVALGEGGVAKQLVGILGLDELAQGGDRFRTMVHNIHPGLRKMKSKQARSDRLVGLYVDRPC